MSIQRFAEFLHEASFAAQDVPAKFYVSIRLRPETYQQLAEGVLPGVAGVAGSKSNAGHWLPLRDAMLAMPGAATAQLNKLSRVRYESVEYLLSNNMRPLMRLNNQSERDGIAGIFVRNLRQALGRTRNQCDTFSVLYGRTNYDEGSRLRAALATARVRSVKDVRTALLATMEREYLRGDAVPTWDTGELDALIAATVKQMGADYDHEHEWLVKDRTLRLPEGTWLYLPKDLDDARISALGLGERYRLIRYDQERIEMYGNKLRGDTYNKKAAVPTHDAAEVATRLESRKNTFLRAELDKYRAHLHQLPIPAPVVAFLDEWTADYFDKHYFSIEVAKLGYLHEWYLNQEAEKAALEEVQRADLRDHEWEVERAFDGADHCIGNLGRRLYAAVRKDWHVLHPNEFPDFYNPQNDPYA